MHNAAIILLSVGLFLVTVIHQSEAMYGLCSTDWFRDAHCFDNNDECSEMGGQCYHDGDGDHGEGCVCKKVIQRGKFFEFEVLTKDHFAKIFW